MRVAVVGMLFGLCVAAQVAAGDAVTVRDPDPGHLWNRLHDALFTRTAPDGARYGDTELDILYWDTTRHLLTPPSQVPALAVLDEFIRDNGERLVRDPVRRAFMQRDLWALFDWSARHAERVTASRAYPAERLELQRRLALIIRRLALSPDEISRLPDNLPAEGPRSADDWLLVGRNDGSSTAPEHTGAFDGRSVFQVWVKLPEGQAATGQYLKTLREFTPAMVYSAGRQPGLPVEGGARQLIVNPATPQFPAGTQWALLRRLVLVDDAGHLRVTPVVESLQLRRYVSIPAAPGDFNALRDSQGVAEWQVDRARLPTLRAVKADERDLQFVHFRSLGVDIFEGDNAANWHRDGIGMVTLRTCMMCHQARGILSVNTFSSFGTSATALDFSTPEREAAQTIAWKAKQYSWGLLNGLWKQ